jgi:hypothetical protein
MPSYKVVEIPFRRLLGGATGAKELEKEINRHAGDGWTLDRIAETQAHGFFAGKRGAYLLVFRK